MTQKGFWSRLFGGGADEQPSRDGDAPPPRRPEAPEPGASATPPPETPPPPEVPPDPDRQTDTPTDAPTDTPPPATAAADDGETRVSGSSSTSKPGFKTDAVSDVYAQALFELAQAAGTLDGIGVEMEQLGRTLADSPDLMRLIRSRALSRDDRAGLIDRVFKEQVDPTVYKFLHVLNRKDRLPSLPAITASFAGRLAADRGIVEVEVSVARRLDEAETDRVAEAIGRSLGKQVVLRQSVDESLIGGLKIRVGDRLIDGSVATKLAKMKRNLIAAGRDKARQQMKAEV